MLEFRYDTQLLIEGKGLDEDAINAYFQEHFQGDCLLAVGDEEVVLDCNHELAGQNLNFDITLVDVVSETPIEHELHPEGCTCGCDRLQESLSAGEH